MLKKEAISIVENTFNEAFNEASFTLFIKNFLNDLDTTKYNEFHGSYIKDAFRKHIKKYKRIGKYTDPNNDVLDVLIVEVADQYYLDHARTSLRNFVITHLDSFQKDYALVAFYSNSDNGADWRFSFVKLEYKTGLKDGKIKQEKELTPAKRYSFLVGEHEKAHTAKKQLMPLLENIYNNPTIEEIEKAFSIEAVTDEFFEQYKTLFGILTKHFAQDSKLKEELAAAGIEIPRFAKKLLGQIVFLYFLQKKGWLGVAKDQKWGSGDKKFLGTLFEQSVAEGKNFFGDYLQFLFYEALAHKHANEGIPGFYSPLNCKVPFLNGGLFDADYDWKNDHITLPNELFRNTDKMGKNGDIGSGILDVFDRYNFTIKEDEPLEKEVAVDPEMLGKVFENMLEVTERKSKGAFYTPREIVHYMCQESLIHYLDNAVNSYSKNYQELGNPQISLFGNEGKKGQQSLILENDAILIPKEDIETFIRKGFLTLENDRRVIREGKETRNYKFLLPDAIRNHADLLDTKLAEIRICDPAIGSGAFPVGMLHEIVNARLILRPHLKINGKNIPENHDTDYAYQLKRHAIQECIYGVDIDASAIDIARLRLWLSLVVDEEDLDTIEALPNLDYKIVCGNSLIGLPETAMRDLAVEEELEGLKDKFFKETDEEHKKELRTQINSKIRQLLDSAEQFAGYKIDFDFKLYFSEVWHKKGGFDVVIGNPPYVEHKKLKAIASLLKPIYEVYTGSSDLSVYFFEKGFKLLKSKGTLTFINTNKFFYTGYGRELRRHILRNTINLIINFEQVEIFDKVLVSSVVFNASKSVADKDHQFAFVGFYKEKNWRKVFHSKIHKERLLFIQSSFNDSEWNFAETSDLKIKKAIEVNSVILKDLNGVDIKRGVTTGYDPAFIIDKKNELPINDIKVVKNLIKGKEIKKYMSLKSNSVLLFLPWHFPLHEDSTISGASKIAEKKLKEEYPSLYSHLANHYDGLSKRNVEETGIRYEWYCLQRCAASYFPQFDLPKIVWPLTADKWGYTIDFDKHYLTSGGFFLISKEISLKYLLAILNSKVLEYYFRFIGVMTAGGAYTLKKATIEDLPIKINDKITEIEIVVSYVLFIKKHDNKLISSFFELLIDSIVFELYFTNEIKSANKEILKHLTDLKQITDDMSDEQKLAIIQSEFERLYDPHHPVRNNVETLDSVEEVRIIRDALK